MSEQQIQPPRGMNDVLPADIAAWQRLESVARELFASYAYQEIRVPIVEHTALFKRSIGEFTDIVQKEMFTFEDPGGDSLTLRPEATAGIVRAMITNGLLHNQRQRVWCAGPMFRHEKPQRGRFRQFYQLDVEAFGYAGPDIDAELILLSARLLKRLGVERVELNLNSLGTPGSRRAYREKLVEYFSAHKARLDADSLRRLDGNPLRILDSKNPELQELIAAAPVLTEYLDAESQQHFDGLRRHLDAARHEIRRQSAARARARLLLAHRVRVGHDRAWFAGSGVLRRALRRAGDAARRRADAGHRLGAGAGAHRRAPARAAWRHCRANAPDVYAVIAGERAEAEGLALIERLRDDLPSLRIEVNCGGGSFKSQLKRADKSGAQFALILGDAETERRVVGLKSLRVEAPQVEIPGRRWRASSRDGSGLTLERLQATVRGGSLFRSLAVACSP